MVLCSATVTSRSRASKAATLIASFFIATSCTADAPLKSPLAIAWAAGVRETLGRTLCNEDVYFRACYRIEEDPCRELMKRHFDACLREHADAVPAFPTASSGRKAGRVLGSCVGINSEKELLAQGRRTETPRCEEISKRVAGR